jgi:hypothetical protein
MTVVIGTVFCLGAFAAAQDNNLPVTSHADQITSDSGRTTLDGNVVLIVNGVVVRADRAVIQDGEVTLEGGVRLTLPRRVYASAVTSARIPAKPASAPLGPPPSPGPRIIDTPIPPPWEPPTRQR